MRRPCGHVVHGRWTLICALILATAGLQAAAGVGLASIAGFPEVHRTLVRFQWPWLPAMVGALAVSYAGYYAAYRGLFRAEGGPTPARRHLRAAVIAGFGGFLAYYGTKLDHSVLRACGADERESSIRSAALSGFEYGMLALGGSVAAIVVIIRHLPHPTGDFTWPWALAPVPGFLLAFWLARRYHGRISRRPGWRSALAVFLDSIVLVRALFTRPARHSGALLGIVVFWAGDVCAAWLGMAAFGFRMDVAQLVVGFATGMVVTRRTGPLAGAGMLLLAVTISVWYSGAPLAVALLGIGVYRLVCVWAPLPFSLAHLPALRQVVERRA